MPILEQFYSWFPKWSIGLIKLSLSVILFYILGRAVVKPLTYRVLRKKSDHLALPLSRFFMYLTVLAGIFVGLIVGGYGNSLGVFGAVAAAATFALGFGMQDTIQAFLAGIFIFIDKPFEIGDWIEWDGNEGRVKDIQLRTTKVETFDNELLTVPNDQIANSIVMNNTANDNLRIRTTFGIGYDDDLEKAKEVVLEVLEDVEEVMGEPGPDVVLQDMGDSSVNLQAFYWIEDPAKAQLRSIKDEVLVRVKERFDEEEIDIPYPTRTIAGESLSVEG